MNSLKWHEAVKEAAVQRRHNLYRDSIVLSNSDPNLHLLGDNPSIDWAEEYIGGQEEVDGTEEEAEGDCEVEGVKSQKKRRTKQVVSMIQVEGSTALPSESCLEVPGVDDILEEDGEEEDGVREENLDDKASCDQNGSASLQESKKPSDTVNGSVLKAEEDKAEEQHTEEIPLTVKSAVEVGEKGEESQVVAEEEPPSKQEESEEVLSQPPATEEVPPGATESASDSTLETTSDLPKAPHDDSGFQSPTSEVVETAPAEKEQEEVASSETAPLTDEEQPEMKETSVAEGEAEAKTSDSETRDQ